MELEYHHFETLNRLMDQPKDHQWIIQQMESYWGTVIMDITGTRWEATDHS